MYYKLLTKVEQSKYFDFCANLNWLHVVKARKELFFAEEVGVTYSYGKPEFANVYVAEPLPKELKELLDVINVNDGTEYNVIFLNRYDEPTEHIGWHSDNSPEMCNEHPIGTLSLYGDLKLPLRRIMTKLIGDLSDLTVREYYLEAGSMFTMPAGFQQTHLHRIPKEGHKVSPRISLTLRKYVKV
jgi:alkylated DNA repair dioxygenase AlkB